MKEQTYTLTDVSNFCLKDTLECGQCFRWNQVEENLYLGIVKNNVIQARQEQNKIVFTSLGQDNLPALLKEYFDLERDYKTIQKKLSTVDSALAISAQYAKGIRILNQDLWETLLSFIISANNNIPRIKGIIERICQAYGKKITWQGKDYYTFPTPDELSRASVEDLRKLGLGFRDKRVYETTQKIQQGSVKLDQLTKQKDTQVIRNILLTLPGVGEKVADCILLFSNLKRLEVFPVDVWVRRVINELYIKNPDETKVNTKQIQELARKKYGNLAGIAQQYLFYWKRENSKEA